MRYGISPYPTTYSAYATKTQRFGMAVSENMTERIKVALVLEECSTVLTDGLKIAASTADCVSAAKETITLFNRLCANKGIDTTSKAAQEALTHLGNIFEKRCIDSRIMMAQRLEDDKSFDFPDAFVAPLTKPSPIN